MCDCLSWWFISWGWTHKVNWWPQGKKPGGIFPPSLFYFSFFFLLSVSLSSCSLCSISALPPVFFCCRVPSIKTQSQRKCVTFAPTRSTVIKHSPPVSISALFQICNDDPTQQLYLQLSRWLMNCSMITTNILHLTTENMNEFTADNFLQSCHLSRFVVIIVIYCSCNHSFF